MNKLDNLLDNLNGGCIGVILISVFLIGSAWCVHAFDVPCWHWQEEVLEDEAASILSSCLERYHDIIMCTDQFTESTDILPEYVGVMFMAAVCFSLVATAWLAIFVVLNTMERFAVNRFVVSIALLISACLMGRFCFWAFQAFIGGWENEMQMTKYAYILNVVGGVVCVSFLVTAILAIVGLIHVLFSPEDIKTKDE